MGKTPKTPKDYHALASNRGLEWLGLEACTTRTKTTWRCTKGHEWEALYGSIGRGHGCPYCAGLTPKTSKDYHALAKSRGFEWLGPEVRNVLTKTTWRCTRGHEWESRYSDIGSGTGCPHCVSTSKTSKDYHDLAASRSFEWLGPEVRNTHTKTTWRCAKGHEWEGRYHGVNSGYGCPHCSGKAPKTSKDYRDLAAIRGFEWLGPEVRNTRTKTTWKCTKGHKWEAVYNGIYTGSGCPHCSLLETQSKGEVRTAKFLAAIDIMFVRQKTFDGCKDKHHLRFDFFFTYADHRFLIEYNGQQHYEPVECWGGKEALVLTQRRDRIKADFAQANGLHLLIIPHTGYGRIGTIIIDYLKAVSGQDPMTFQDRARDARGPIKAIEGIQLNLFT